MNCRHIKRTSHKEWSLGSQNDHGAANRHFVWQEASYYSRSLQGRWAGRRAQEDFLYVTLWSGYWEGDAESHYLPPAPTRDARCPLAWVKGFLSCPSTVMKIPSTWIFGSCRISFPSTSQNLIHTSLRSDLSWIKKLVGLTIIISCFYGEQQTAINVTAS